MRILVVDDSPDDRALVRRAILKEIPSCAIEEVSSPEQFARALERMDFKLVITDYHIKWITGIEVLHAVKARNSMVPVIMFTGTGSEEIAVDAMKAGLEDYVIKTIRHSLRLPAAVRLALERAESKTKAAEVETRLQSLLENVNVGVFRLKLDGTLIEGNPAFLNITGLEQDAPFNLHKSFVLPAGIPDPSAMLAETGDIRLLDVQMRRPNGDTIWVRVKENTVKSPMGATFIDGMLEDVTQIKESEERIKASLKEKEVLLQEVHHRVKNNLQLISSMLNLQMKKTRDTILYDALKDCQNRVKSLAFIHERLYQSENLAAIEMADYVEMLVTSLVRSFGTDGSRISVDVDVQKNRVDVDTAIICGLIVNELASNSLKHAFPNGRCGRISISHAKKGDAFLLAVSDDGVGFDWTTVLGKSDSLGIQLVNALSDQLGARLRVSADNGTRFVIEYTPQKK